MRGARVLFRDPALSARVCGAPALALQRARAAPGTDQDLILVDLRARTAPGPPWPLSAQPARSASALTLRTGGGGRQLRWSGCAVQ